MASDDRNKVQTYADYIDEQKAKERDHNITQSMDALGTLGATMGIGGMIAGKPKFGIPTAAGAAGAMLGYHGTKILGGGVAARLIAAAVVGSGAAGAAWLNVADK